MRKIIALCITAALVIIAMPISGNIFAATVETGTVADKTYVLGDELYYTDFEDATVGALPSGWQIAYDKTWGYNAGGKTGNAAVAELGSLGKVLTYGSNGVDTFVSMPEINTRNYVFEATFLTASTATSGSFGIANGMYGGISSATGAVFTSVPVKYSVGGSGYYRSKGLPSVQKVDFTVPIKTPPGTTLKMKFVSFNGINYYCINDNYIGAYVQGESESESDWAGFYTYNGSFHISEVKITEIINSDVEFNNVSIVPSNGNVGLKAELSFDKTSKLYKKHITGNYAYSENAAVKFGLLVAVSDSVATNNITADTEGVINNLFKTFTQTKEKIYFSYEISPVESKNLDKFYEFRPYILIGSQYFYGQSRSYSPSRLANNTYSVSDEETRALISEAFKDSAVFKGDNKKTLTFALFSDFHYKENMYTVSIADLRSILKRAEDNNSAFIMSAGDFCNDFAGSPELTNTYLNYKQTNGTVLSAYNVYGNHELETSGNSMENVTPTLTNDENVVWGTEDGSFDCNIGYYYFENNGFRIVCTDTNYSLNSSGEWEHNLPATYGAASGNTKTNSLGDVQLAWLEKVLLDAADKGIPCIVVSHDGFSGKFATSSSDAEAVRQIYAKANAVKAGTVIMSINGHHHTNHQGYNDGVFYFDMNTTRNGWWKQMPSGSKHYTSGQTYIYEKYDENGNLLDLYERNINELYQAQNTWFFADPVSAIVTVDEFGTISIDGAETTWMYDVKPNTTASGVEPKVTSGTFWDCGSLSHNWSNELSYNEGYHWYPCANKACSLADISLSYGYEAHNFENIEKDEFLVEGATATYYKSCICGAVSSEKFGEGVNAPEPTQVWDGSIAEGYAGGDGSADSPYLIENAKQLARMIGYDVLTNYTGNTANGSTDKYYKLMSDIYINDVSESDWYSGSDLNEWYSSYASRFCGSLDGNGYTVYGLYFAADATNAGLIPVIDVYHNSRYVKNLTISDSYITSTNMSGAIASRVYGGTAKRFTIENCYITDSVMISTTGDNVGGLLGFSSVNNATQGTTTYIDVKNTAILATKPDGSALSFGAVGISYSNYSNYLTVSNSFAYAANWEGITNKGSIENSYLLSSLSSVTGDSAKETLTSISGFYFADGYPLNVAIGQLKGDINGDNIGDSLDLVDFRQHLLNLKTAALIDVNGDGQSDVRDVVNLKNKLANR